jgi:hypothetical protein
MLKSYTRMIVALAGLASFVAAPAAVAGSSGPSPSAIAFLREAGGLDPYDTSKDTHVTGQGANAWNYTSEVVAAPWITRDGYPGPGGSAVLIGALETSTFGSGAVVDRIKVTGQPEPNVVAFKGKEVDFFDAGTMRNKLTGTTTIADDGSLEILIHGTFTGGTRLYRGAAGSYDYSGEMVSGSTMAKGHSTGHVTF